MIQHIKNFWKRYMATALTLSVPAAYAGGLEMGKQKAPELDCKGQVCSVVVDIKEADFHGKRTYVKVEWDAKTAEDIKADRDKRIKDTKDLITRQSQLVSPPEDEIQ